MSEELTIEKIARRVRGNGYWSLVDGVSTFDVAEMSDDLRTLLANLDEMRAEVEKLREGIRDCGGTCVNHTY